VSRRSRHRVLHDLRLKPYLAYCEWLLNMVAGRFVDPFLFFSTDEAWFHPSEYVNAQNTWYWSSENPHMFRQRRLHNLKSGVWCAVSENQMVGPIFFNETINTDVYLRIFDEFVGQLTEPHLLPEKQSDMSYISSVAHSNTQCIHWGRDCQCRSMARPLQSYRLMIFALGLVKRETLEPWKSWRTP
jgi:hypothetical protein